MRLPRVVAGVALIAALAAVAVPTVALSVPPSADATFDPLDFVEVRVDSVMSGPTTTFELDPASNSANRLGEDGSLGDPVIRAEPLPRPAANQPAAPLRTVVLNVWHRDPEVSFYGPGFYGKRTACGLAYTTTIMGVAHRTLPCGTRVQFKNPANGKVITVPVIDRGPYVDGRQWDLSGAACTALNHCYTGPLLWRFPPG